MLKKFLSTVYIVVIESENGAQICAYSTKGSNISNKYIRTFDAAAPARRFLQQLLENHYFSYVSVLFKSIGQGVLPSSNKSELVNYGVEPTNIGLLAMDGFYIYASKSEIELARNCAFGLLESDLIYSPFSILHRLFLRKKPTGCVLYLLKYHNQVTVMIYNNQLACFGNYFELKSPSTNPSSSTDDALDGLIDESDSESEFDELTFEDLDSIESKDDFELGEPLAQDPSSLQNFDVEMAIFEYLKTAIREYYENPLYSGDFLNDIYIFEHEESSQAFLQMIKSEFYLTPHTKKIDLFYELFSLSSQDLGANIDT